MTNLLFLTVLGQPSVITIAATTAYRCRSLDPDCERMGDVVGEGRFIAFALRVKCGDNGAPDCPTSTRTLISQTGPPCPTIKLQLLDAKRGVVAYVLNGKLHLLRLRDGVNKVVANATDARFGDNGLYYAYTGAAPWVSRIRFVRWASLPVQP